MEGKEVRFGIFNSALFATVTTDASCGAVNSMHDSFTPLGGLVPLFNIQLGEVVFGGVGAGLYGMLVFVVLAVFLAGLMVGPHPGIPGEEDRVLRREGRRPGHHDAWSSHPGLHGLGVGRPGGAWQALNNAGPHGFSEMLYAFSSAPATTAAPLPGSPATPPGTTRPWAWPCSSGASS